MVFPCLALEAPHYAVIFTSRRTPIDAGYADTADKMEALASAQPGYLGIESVRDKDGRGITVSYWRDADSVSAFRQLAEHRVAQARGRTDWYEAYEIRVCRVERAYGFRNQAG